MVCLKNFFYVISVLFYFSAFAETKISFVVQNYPPYSYKNDQGIQGVYANLVRQIIEDAGLENHVDRFEVVSFSRSVVMGRNQHNTVFFPMTKAPERESHFIWVGPIGYGYPVVVSKKKDKNFSTITVAYKENYYAEEQLQNLKTYKMVAVSNEKQAFEMLKNNEVDAVLCDEQVVQFWQKELKFGQYHILKNFGKTAYYLMVNSKTDLQIIKLLEQSVNKLVK